MTDNHIPGEVIRCPAPTPTVEAAAQVMGVPCDQIVKTILFLAGGQPVVVIACGTGAIDRKPVAERFGVGRKQVRLADPERVLALTGYPAGGVPPFGHRQLLPTLIDPRVLAQPVVFAGGGEEDVLVRVDPRVILQVTRAEIVPVLVSGRDDLTAAGSGEGTLHG
ncbi:MAG TPA: YbaK/EbsC family protein [Anaerolineaceae bacterium]